MSKHDVENAGLAIINSKYQRLLAAGTACLLIGKTCVEQIFDVGRASHTVVHFIFGVYPIVGQAFDDRVLLVTAVHWVLALCAM